GVVFFKLITGRLPFDGNRVALILKKVHENPPAPSRFRPGLDPALDMIVLKALSKNPEKRFATAREFGKPLVQWQLNQAMVDPPQTALFSPKPEETRVVERPLPDDKTRKMPAKQSRRRRLMALCVLLAAVILVSGGLIWFAFNNPYLPQHELAKPATAKKP